MSSMQSGPDSDKVLLHECLYWNCPCGQRNIEYWTAKELHTKHIDRLRKKGKALHQTYWTMAAPTEVRCTRCGKEADTLPFVAD